MLPLMFRYMVTHKSLAWMYDYRVPSGRPVVDEPIGAAEPNRHSQRRTRRV